MKCSLFIFLLILSISVFLPSTPLSAQDRVNISIGLGIPDLFNAGVRVHHRQIQVGVSGGFLPIGTNRYYSYALDTYWHFAGKAQLSTRRPWYWKNGIGMIHDKSPSRTKNYTYYNSRIGIEWYADEKLGFQFEMGAGRLLRTSSEGRSSSFISFDLPDLLVGIAFSLFFRI